MSAMSRWTAEEAAWLIAEWGHLNEQAQPLRTQAMNGGMMGPEAFARSIGLM